jgi:hypothetical protein
MSEEVPTDPWRILLVLQAVEADFVVVGSTAAWAHGASRRPNDVDVVIRDGWSNLERLAHALVRLHALPNLRGYDAEDLARVSYRIDAGIIADLPISSWRTDGGSLDLIDALLGGLDYDRLASRAELKRLGAATVQVASLADLIASKRAAGRAVDYCDLAELERLRRVRQQSSGARPRQLCHPSHGLDL